MKKLYTLLVGVAACAAPLRADESGRRLVVRPTWHYIAHLSRFLRPGAVRLGCSRWTSDVEAVVTHTTDQNGHPIGVTLTKTIENQAGTQLPSTGGVGTTIFYVLGGVMVLGAVAVLVARKRVSE